MKKFSKLFWVALVVVAVLACTAIGVFAAETVSTAVVYGETAEVAENFSVDFNFKENNTAVECGKITLTWDSNKMTATSISAADALDGAQFGSKIEDGKAVIAWAGSFIDDETAEGTLFTVNFANKGIAADEYTSVAIAVDNFGYTESFVATELKDTVKAGKAYAMGEEFDGSLTYTSETTESPAEFIGSALEIAAAGQAVTITLEADMVFNAKTEIGTPEIAAAWAEGGKISFVSNPAGTYGIKLDQSPVVVMYGKYEFSNMLLDTVAYAAKGSDRYDNALFFPDDSSAVFGEGLAKTSSAKAINLAGNVEVNSGTYSYIAANTKGSGVKIEKELNITVQGSTVTSYVAGGMIEGASNNGQVNAKSNVKILGNAKVTADVIGGGRYTGVAGTAGADIIINTTNSISRVVALCGTLDEASVFNIRIVNASSVARVAAAVMYDGGTAGKAVVRDENGAVTTAGTEINFYVDGGTVTDFFGGIYATYTGYYTENGVKTNVTAETAGKAQNNAAIKGEVNIYVNRRDAIEGIEYPSTKAKITNFYGGSDFSVCNSQDRANRKIFVYEGTTFGSFTAGSKMDVINGKHMGNTEVTIYGLTQTSSSHIYGGSRLTSSGTTHSGDTVMTFDGIDNYVRTDVAETDSKYDNTKNFILQDGSSRIVGASLLSNATAVHSGDATINLLNVTMGRDYPGHIHGGAYADKSGSKMTGNTTVNIILDKANGEARVEANVFGGSMLAQDGIQSGNSRVYINIDNGTKMIIGGSDARCIYGGSNVQGNSTTLGAYHSGDSEVEIGTSKGINFQNGNAMIFGGSYYTRANNVKPAGIGNPEDDTYPTARLILGNTLILRMFGGSRVEAAATVYQNSSLIINGKGTTDETIAGGSYFTADNGKQVGNTSLEINGTRTLGRDSNTSYTLVATGGIYTEKAGVVHEGNATLTLNSSYYDKNDAYGSLHRYDVIAAGGYGVSKLIGNSELNIKNGTIKLRNANHGDAEFTAETQRITTAGIYGTGTMEGNITANIEGGNYYYASNASFYIGSYGTNVLAAPEGSSYARGFRQVGDITCNFSGGSTGDQIQLIGKNNDLDGNVYFNMSGTANGGYVHMRNTLAKALNGDKAEDYAYVITGDVVSKISGGKLTYGISMGGPYSSTAVIEGNNIMEISGGTLDRTDNNYRFELGLGATTNGKDVIKFVGNNITLDPVDAANASKTGMNIYSIAGNTAILDLFQYTGDVEITGSNFDKTIAPFTEGVTVGTFTSDELEVGTKLDTLIPETLTIGDKTYTYAELTQFDAYTDNDNAFVFVDAATNEVITEVSQELTAVKVKVGERYSAPITLNVKEPVYTVNGTVTNAEADVTVQLINGEEVVYEATVTPVDGSAAYAFKAVAKGTYTLKVTSEGRETYTEEITVAKEDITKDVTLVTPKPVVVPVTFQRSMQAMLDLEDSVKMGVGYKLEGMENFDVTDEEFLSRFGLLVWKSEISEEDALITHPDAVATYGATYNADAGRFETRTNGIPAKMLGDKLWFRAFFVNEDGSYSYSRVIANYSPTTYCFNQIRDNYTNKNLVNLMASILQYGTEAQLMFNHNTDNLMIDILDGFATNKTLTLTTEEIAELKSVDWDPSIVRTDFNVPDGKDSAYTKANEITTRGGNLDLEDKIGTRFYSNVNFKATSAKIYYWFESDIAGLDSLNYLENARGSADMVWSEANSRYEYLFEGRAAKEMFETIFVIMVYEDGNGNTITSGVVGYSPERFGYINGVQKTTPSTNLARATVVYGKAAKTYFG